MRSPGFFAVALAACLLFASWGAAAQSFQPFVVKDIRVEGLQRTEPGTVFSYLPVKVGEPLDAAKAQQALRALYATAFEVDPLWIVEAGARRQKWIDQAQSLNIYMGGASGKKLDDTYKLAWTRGLKTTYYLRTLAKTSAEKSTGRGGELNAVPESGAMNAIAASASHVPAAATAEAEPKFCAIDDPTCEACQ